MQFFNLPNPIIMPGPKFIAKGNHKPPINLNIFGAVSPTDFEKIIAAVSPTDAVANYINVNANLFQAISPTDIEKLVGAVSPTDFPTNLRALNINAFIDVN